MPGRSKPPLRVAPATWGGPDLDAADMLGVGDASLKVGANVLFRKDGTTLYCTVVADKGAQLTLRSVGSKDAPHHGVASQFLFHVPGSEDAEAAAAPTPASAPKPWASKPKAATAPDPSPAPEPEQAAVPTAVRIDLSEAKAASLGAAILAKAPIAGAKPGLVLPLARAIFPDGVQLVLALRNDPAGPYPLFLAQRPDSKGKPLPRSIYGPTRCTSTARPTRPMSSTPPTPDTETSGR